MAASGKPKVKSAFSFSLSYSSPQNQFETTHTHKTNGKKMKFVLCTQG